MTRLAAAMKNDVLLQLRNKLYAIGVGVAALVAILFSQLLDPDMLPIAVPVTMLMVVGGTTLLYVAGMILFERDEGTISATVVSPLRTWEYLWSKILTLTALATLESAVMIGGAMGIMSFTVHVALPSLLPLVLGTFSIGMVYTLVGILIIVRYESITDFLMPMAAIVTILQLPFLHFLGVVEHPLFLLVPTSAQTMLMRGAYMSLTVLEWVYAVGYTMITLVVLSMLAQRSFRSHIVMRLG